MKKFVNLSLALLLAATVVPVQAMEIKTQEIVSPADEELEIVPFETQKEVSFTDIAKELALPAAVTTFVGAFAYTKLFNKEKTLPVALAGLGASLFYMRAFKPENEKVENPTVLRTTVNAVSKKVNEFFAFSYKYKDPINDAICICALVYMCNSLYNKDVNAIVADSKDTFNNASKCLPYGIGNFMKAK